ncbi:hypothetical protein JD969_17435 [Planctomycetota bacterium]|nr:hypothetical protein JD969_17435 [Planctomycetota bacterium]
MKSTILWILGLIAVIYGINMISLMLLPYPDALLVIDPINGNIAQPGRVSVFNGELKQLEDQGLVVGVEDDGEIRLEILGSRAKVSTPIDLHVYIPDLRATDFIEAGNERIYTCEL